MALWNDLKNGKKVIDEGGDPKKLKKVIEKASKEIEKGIKKLDNGPKWALWQDHGTVNFGTSIKDAKIVYDINNMKGIT